MKNSVSHRWIVICYCHGRDVLRPSKAGLARSSSIQEAGSFLDAGNTRNPPPGQASFQLPGHLSPIHEPPGSLPAPRFAIPAARLPGPPIPFSAFASVGDLWRTEALGACYVAAEARCQASPPAVLLGGLHTASSTLQMASMFSSGTSGPHSA